MKKLNIGEYAQDIKCGLQEKKEIGAFTLKLYASRIAIFRGGEYINEIDFDKDTFDSSTKYAGIKTIEDILNAWPEIKTQLEDEENKMKLTTMDKVVSFEIVDGKINLSSEQIDEMKDKTFIPANDETRSTLIKVSDSTILNAKELLAIVGKLKELKAAAPFGTKLKLLLKDIHPDWDDGKLIDEVRRMMKMSNLKTIAEQEAIIMKFKELKTGDEFVFASNPKEIYKLYQLTKDTAFLSQTVGAKVNNVKIPIKHRKDDVVYKMAAKKKLKYFQKEPLKTMDDYEKIDPKMKAEFEEIANGLYKEAFGLWDSLKTVVDMISPFISFFVKNPKLKQAYNLLTEVIREKSAIYGEDILVITADEYLEKKYSQYGKDLREDVEDFMLDQGKTYKDSTEADIVAVIQSRKQK